MRRKRNILSVNQRVVCKSKKYYICKLKNYLQTEKLSALSRNYFQIKSPSGDRIIIFQPKNYLQIEELSGYQRIIFCRLKKYLICRRNICRLKNYLWIKVQSTDGSLMCRQFLNFQIALWFADTSSVYKLNASLIWR